MKLSGISKYISPVKYWHRFLSLMNKFVLQYFDILMSPDYGTPFKHPPIFILGAPRSGSTLIYQVITDAFDVAYLSNRHCQNFGVPALVERIFSPSKNKSPSNYTSNHGQTIGWSAPSECGGWWYRFFPTDPVYVTLADVNEYKMRCFRRSLLSFTEVNGKSVVFKNLYASMRLEAITKYIPEALFVVIKRNEIDNAHSILEGRMKALGCYDQWWSLPPPNVEQLKLLEPAQQVVEQIRTVHDVINQAIDADLIDRGRVLTIQYENFCEDVHRSIYEFEKFFLENGLTVARRSSVPGKFPLNRAIRIEKKLYSELQEIVCN